MTRAPAAAAKNINNVAASNREPSTGVCFGTWLYCRFAKMNFFILRALPAVRWTLLAAAFILFSHAWTQAAPPVVAVDPARVKKIAAMLPAHPSGSRSSPPVPIDTDVQGMLDGYVTMTPLQFDMTQRRQLEEYRGLNWKLT